MGAFLVEGRSAPNLSLTLYTAAYFLGPKRSKELSNSTGVVGICSNWVRNGPYWHSSGWQTVLFTILDDVPRGRC
jgi:hypothetical protein